MQSYKQTNYWKKLEEEKERLINAIKHYRECTITQALWKNDIAKLKNDLRNLANFMQEIEMAEED